MRARDGARKQGRRDGRETNHLNKAGKEEVNKGENAGVESERKERGRGLGKG